MQLLVFFFSCALSDMVKLLPKPSLTFEDVMLILFTTVADLHIAPSSSLSHYKLYIQCPSTVETFIFLIPLILMLAIWLVSWELNVLILFSLASLCSDNYHEKNMPWVATDSRTRKRWMTQICIQPAGWSKAQLTDSLNWAI